MTLLCSISTKEDAGLQRFEWKKDGQTEVFLYDTDLRSSGLQGQDEQFKGRVSYFAGELQHSNASITITKTQVADSGDYTCDFPHRRQKRQIRS